MVKSMLETALAQYGQKEVPGEQDNPIIVQYAKDAGFTWVGHDETPWCSIFINWVAMKCGNERTHSAAARSWLNVGQPTNEPELGDVVVFARGDSTWQGHVGLFINFSGTNGINVLGGNQKNQVCIETQEKGKLLGYRKLGKI